MTLALIRTLTLGEGDSALVVTVRELTVGEIRTWLKELASAAPADAVDLTLFADITLTDLVHLTDLAPERIDALTPSQLRAVFDLAREVNADFFGLRARLAEWGSAIQPVRSSEPSAA